VREKIVSELIKKTLDCIVVDLIKKEKTGEIELQEGQLKELLDIKIEMSRK